MLECILCSCFTICTIYCNLCIAVTSLYIHFYATWTGVTEMVLLIHVQIHLRLCAVLYSQSSARCPFELNAVNFDFRRTIVAIIEIQAERRIVVVPIRRIPPVCTVRHIVIVSIVVWTMVHMMRVVMTRHRASVLGVSLNSSTHHGNNHDDFD